MRHIGSLLLALVLVTAACGGDDGSVLGAPTPTTASGATTTGNATATPTTASTPTTTESAAATPTTAGAPIGDVQAALANYETAAIRTVYRFGQGDDEQIVTISRDPNLDPPVSATLIGPDGADGRFITIGDRTVICGPPGQECIEFPPEMGFDMGTTLLGPVLSGFLLNDDLASTPGFSVEEGTATIAGRAGICFTFTPGAFVAGADVELIRQCIDAELGFILLIEALEAGGTAVDNIMEMLEFGLPTPGDFELSGPVTTMPGG